jgi:hypothetical protein
MGPDSGSVRVAHFTPITSGRPDLQSLSVRMDGRMTPGCSVLARCLTQSDRSDTALLTGTCSMSSLEPRLVHFPRKHHGGWRPPENCTTHQTQLHASNTTRAGWLYDLAFWKCDKYRFIVQYRISDTAWHLATVSPLPRHTTCTVGLWLASWRALHSCEASDSGTNMCIWALTMTSFLVLAQKPARLHACMQATCSIAVQVDGC